MRSVPSSRISLAIVLMGSAWRASDRLAAHAMPAFGCLLAACGIGILAASTRLSCGGQRISKLAVFILVIVCLVLMISTNSLQASVYGASAALLLLALVPGWGTNRWIGALSVGAVVITFTGASTIILRQVGWRLHDIRIPDVVGLVMGNLGIPAGTSGGLLTIWTGRGLETARLSFEGLGVYEITYFTVAVAILTSFSGRCRGGRRLLADVVRILGYAVVRVFVITSLAIEFGRNDLLWHPASTALTWLPLAFILRPPDSPSLSPLAIEIRQREASVRILPVVAGIALACALAYSDPGNLKDGRIMFDEGHSNWEWTQEPFDTTAFGIRAEYNYSCLFDYLSHFYTVRANTERISSSLLDTVDILIIKTPTEPFGSDEIEAITGFVKDGGGLLLIGDHTNLFGMTDYLNAIATRFGMHFHYDDTFDLATTGFSVYERPRIWFHPCVRGISEFAFLTSCTLAGDLMTEPVMVGCALGSEDGDYGHPNFFGNIAFDLRDRFGLFAQAGAKSFGRGRVLLFTDSTCFSNFCLFGPGNLGLVLGFVDYLNREGKRYPGAKPVLWSIFGMLVGVSGLRRVPGGLTWVWLGLFCGFVLGIFGASHLNSGLYGDVAAATVRPSVFFDTEHTKASLSDYLGSRGQHRTPKFEQFFLCVRRIGMYPETGNLMEIKTRNPHGVILLNPSASFTRRELHCLLAYVRGGGRLLVLDSILNETSTANEVLSRYGLMVHLVSGPAGAGLNASPLAGESVDLLPQLMIRGGESLRQSHDGHTVVACVRDGAGTVTVAVDSHRYSQLALGPLLQTGKPSGLARRLHREACSLLEDVFSVR